jgi:hypothetical protein
MSKSNFEQLKDFAKFVGYDNAVEHATYKSGNPLNKVFTLYSKEPINIVDSYEKDGKTISVIDKEWSNYYNLETLTSNSFSPNTKWGSLMICNREMMKTFNTKEVSYFEGKCQVEYLHPEEELKTDIGTIQSIKAAGEDEFEATYNAIHGFIEYLNGR